MIGVAKNMVAICYHMFSCTHGSAVDDVHLRILYRLFQTLKPQTIHACLGHVSSPTAPGHHKQSMRQAALRSGGTMISNSK